MVLARILIQKGACTTPKAKQQWQGLLYSILEGFIILCNGREHQGEEGCVWYV